MNGGLDPIGALIVGGPLLLLSAATWVSLKLSARQARREQAKTRHPAKGTLSAAEQLEWMRISGALVSEMETEGRHG